ncbi:MAG: NAD(P)-dependent oxidoreductase [Verrucomicrobiota bacterium JB023]|nr:NAD(P)-dependent oxidoreductase [Verrucomicrobiota bacterium JB023]
MKLLLTGTTGKVGGYLARHWMERWTVSALTRARVDLTAGDDLRSFLREEEFDCLINPAAVSTPEACEAEPELAERVNVIAPRIMAEVCAEKGVPFIHLSTDYVLDGSQPGLKAETAPAEPTHTYGQTKLAGERAVLEAYPQALVARVSWVFASEGEAFLEKIVRLTRAGSPLEAVADKFSMPTSAPELAAALEHLLARQASGLIHLTQSSAEPVSWHRYAEEVVDALYSTGTAIDLPAARPEVVARRMADIPVLRTNRPVHTAMKPARLTEEFGFAMRDWKTAVRERVADLT